MKMESMMAYVENCKKLGNEDEKDVRDQGTNIAELMNQMPLDIIFWK